MHINWAEVISHFDGNIKVAGAILSLKKGENMKKISLGKKGNDKNPISVDG